jgi:hypothetical protein
MRSDVIGPTTVVLGALAAAPITCALAVPLHHSLQGRVIYDVAVPVVDHPDRAILGGLVLFVVLCPLLLWLLGRIGKRISLAFWVGIPWMLIWAMMFAFVVPLL